jgi:hypothetical protein
MADSSDFYPVFTASRSHDKIRRQKNTEFVRIYPFPADSSFSIDIHLPTLRISWPEIVSETIDTAELFARALLCALEEVQRLLDERARKHTRASRSPEA